MSELKPPVGFALPALPARAVDRVIEPLRRFLHIEAASGVVLLVCAVIALVWANSGASDTYFHILHTPIFVGIGEFQLNMTLHHWINDALMTIFFFVVGLEIKREFVSGELNDPKRAALPLAAALGGMVAPAAIYLLFQYGEAGERGWGIPMATDIAFVVGVMALLGPRVPHGLRVMLLTLAIADDIGAVIVIAIGYTDDLSMLPLVLGFMGFGFCMLLNYAGVRNVWIYTFIGGLIWCAFLASGVHSTIAGVILGLITPAYPWLGQRPFSDSIEKIKDFLQGEGWSDHHEAPNDALQQLEITARETRSPLLRLERALHPWSAFLIMPLFALANAGVVLKMDAFAHPVQMAVFCGLTLGKPIGVMAISWIFVKLGVARLPTGATWRMMLGAGCLAGIGFTMALFVAGLAVSGDLLDPAKIGIFSASLISGILGYIILATSKRAS